MILHALFMGAGLCFEEGENEEQVKYQAAHHEFGRFSHCYQASP